MSHIKTKHQIANILKVNKKAVVRFEQKDSVDPTSRSIKGIISHRRGGLIATLPDIKPNNDFCQMIDTNQMYEKFMS
jgi:hypothetical protein